MSLNSKTRKLRRRSQAAALCAALGLTGTLAACGGSSSPAATSPPSAGTATTGMATTGAGSATTGSASATTGSGSGAAADGVAYAKAQLAKYTPLFSNFTPPGPALSGVKGKMDGKVVWYVPIFLQAPIFTADSVGITQALKLAGATVHVCDAATNPSQANSCLTQAVSSHAAGIVTDAMDYSFAPNGYAAALAAHIPVVAAGNDNSKGFPSSPYLTTVSAGFDQTYRLGMDWIIADSNGKAEILYAGDTSNAGVIETAAANDELHKYCPDCKLHTVTFGDASVQNLASSMSSAMAANPGVTYVNGGYDAPSGIFALQGVNQVKGRKFAYVAATGQPPGLQRIANGTQAVDPGSDTLFSMYNVADNLFRLALGQQPVQHVVALRVFTKANVPSDPGNGGDYASGTWYTDGSFKAMYQKLWGL